MTGILPLKSQDEPHDAANRVLEPPQNALEKVSAVAGTGKSLPPLWVLYLGAAGACLALILAIFLWQKLSHIQEQLARQSAETGSQALEARGLARQASELARETAARVAVVDARLSEVALQRSQLDELIQSLSRSRDENLVVDIESAVRLAQQQAQMTGSAEPLLAALKSADLRVQRAAQPRLSALARAINKDLARIQASSLADTPALLVKLDELIRLVDELPLANAVGGSAGTPIQVKQGSGDGKAGTEQPADAGFSWQIVIDRVKSELRGLLRVSRVEVPDAAILSPEQSFFARENLKLKLLNARLGLLARQLDASRGDLASVATSMRRYFSPQSPKTQVATALLQQVQSQMRMLELPRVDETLGALTTAAAGR